MPVCIIGVAVLPLSNYSQEPGQDYFADGMTEALTMQLSQIQGFHVISRTSVMRYKAEPKPIPVIAREIGVDFVVEGSVVRADNRVHVTAQLIEAKSDKHLWARSYDGTLKDILDLQTRIASAIATEVKGVLVSARGPRRAVDPVAYDLYLRGRHAWGLRTQEGFESAIKSFTAAIARRVPYRQPGRPLGRGHDASAGGSAQSPLSGSESCRGTYLTCRGSLLRRSEP